MMSKKDRIRMIFKGGKGGRKKVFLPSAGQCTYICRRFQPSPSPSLSIQNPSIRPHVRHHISTTSLSTQFLFSSDQNLSCSICAPPFVKSFRVGQFAIERRPSRRPVPSIGIVQECLLHQALVKIIRVCREELRESHLGRPYQEKAPIEVSVCRGTDFMVCSTIFRHSCQPPRGEVHTRRVIPKSRALV